MPIFVIWFQWGACYSRLFAIDLDSIRTKYTHSLFIVFKSQIYLRIEALVENCILETSFHESYSPSDHSRLLLWSAEWLIGNLRVLLLQFLILFPFWSFLLLYMYSCDIWWNEQSSKYIRSFLSVSSSVPKESEYFSYFDHPSWEY